MILTKTQARVLRYVHVANLGHVRPTGKEINQWRKAPKRIPAQPGEVIHPAVPGKPARRMPRANFGLSSDLLQTNFGSNLLKNMAIGGAVKAMDFAGSSGVFGAASLAYETIPGTPGKPAVHGPEQPREGFLEHMCRLGWLLREDNKYQVTELGLAFLREFDQRGADSGGVTVLAAEEGNVDYSTTIGQIADSGDALVIDPWLDVEQLRDLLESTSVSRVIFDRSGSNDAGKRAAIGTQFRTWQQGNPDRAVELRQVKSHDRWIVGEHKFYMLGSSLNGIGKSKISTLVEIPPKGAEVLRKYAETLWEKAVPISSYEEA